MDQQQDDETQASEHARETEYSKFLETEIEHLEKLLDDQEEEIDELDKIVLSYKKKTSAMHQELKTKRRSMLFLEEKYAVLKMEYSSFSNVVHPQSDPLNSPPRKASGSCRCSVIGLSCSPGGT